MLEYDAGDKRHYASGRAEANVNAEARRVSRNGADYRLNHVAFGVGTQCQRPAIAVQGAADTSTPLLELLSIYELTTLDDCLIYQK